MELSNGSTEEIPTTDDTINQKERRQSAIQSSLLPREPDSPDRALSIVSELKSNAALFAAFAYGGLSIPSTLTVNESKVTSVTTSISTTRPLPGNELIQSFVVLDTVTLCLMISCVAASQLLIYRLTDGSWYDYLDERGNDDGMQAVTTTPDTTSVTFSAMGRLVSDYGLEFTVARTTFDMGLVSLLLAVAVRAIAIFDASISVPIVALLGGTCAMLAAAYLQSYIKVIQRLEETTKSETRKRILPNDTSSSGYAIILIPSFIAISAMLTVFSFSPSLDDGQVSAKPMNTEIMTPKSSPSVLKRFQWYSTTAAEAKLQSTVNKVAEEKAAKATGNEITDGKRGSTKFRETASGDVSKDDKEVKRSGKKKTDDDRSRTVAKAKSVLKPKPRVDRTGSREDVEEKKPEEKQSTK